MPEITPKHVIVIGGGLAGMAAAVALESVGVQVTLLESRRTLGGRAGSFDDPQTGEQLDNCQHVLLGCCTNLLDFYRRIGADRLIQFHRQIHFRDARGKRYDLFGVKSVPAPLHLAPSLLRFSALTWHERLKLSEAMLHMASMGTDGRNRLAHVPFGDWLDEHDQPESLVTKLYDPVVVSGLNEETRRASAKYAVQIFQESLLANAGGYVFGLPACPLGELYRSFPCNGVRFGARVSAFQIAHNKISDIELSSGETLRADAYVLATNHHAVQKWFPASTTKMDSRFSRLNEFDSVPILGVHLWFDRPILRESHAALISGPLQWVFRKDADGKAVHGVISAARQWVDRDKDELLSMFERQIRSTFPEASGAALLRGVVVIEKRVLFSPLPGIDDIRPSQVPPPGGIGNLFLAGDYTRTHWPATMEGAVRSGYLAADAIIQQFKPNDLSKPFLVDDLPVQWPARLLGYRRGRL